MRKFKTLEDLFAYYDGLKIPSIIITKNECNDYIVWSFVRDNVFCAIKSNREYVMMPVDGRDVQVRDFKRIFTVLEWSINLAEFFDTKEEFIIQHPEYIFE